MSGYYIMENNVIKAIEEYQCSGCMIGGDISCFKPYADGVGCGRHFAGTIISGIGKIVDEHYVPVEKYNELNDRAINAVEKGINIAYNKGKKDTLVWKKITDKDTWQGKKLCLCKDMFTNEFDALDVDEIVIHRTADIHRYRTSSGYFPTTHYIDIADLLKLQKEE